MKHLPIDCQLFIKNRGKLATLLSPNSVAIFNANDIMPTNGDGTMPFKQNSDLFYLTGVDQEDTILVLYPDAKEDKHKEMLFVTETNDEIAIWEGEKLDKEAAYETSGIRSVYWLDDFEKAMGSIMIDVENVYLNSNEHARRANEVETRDERFRDQFTAEYPLHNYKRATPLMHQLRAVKEPQEIELMQRACNITKSGFERVLNFVQPGVWEHEIEAEYMHEFLRNRSTGFAYTPIVASGYNACVLHYIENNQECKDGDLILMDVGAEYANYDSDMTRCIPVNGKFSERQKEIYSAVLRVKKKCEGILRPGITLGDYHKRVGEFMTEELLQLNLLTQEEVDEASDDWPAYKKYFMHGTSHYIGIDTHDVGTWSDPIPEGSVFTIEPGIYIPEENLGIRLEDDYVVHKDGLTNLMGEIPIEIEDIEAAMAK